MNPKEMTNDELRRVLLTCDGKGVVPKTEALNTLLEREADALRKENAELKTRVAQLQGVLVEIKGILRG